MVYTNLGIGITFPRKLIQNFCIYHSTSCFQPVLIEEFRTVELKGTIYIAYTQTKNKTYQHFPAPGIELAHPRILAINAIPQYRIVLVNEREETLQIMYIKLTIRIHKKASSLLIDSKPLTRAAP